MNDRQERKHKLHNISDRLSWINIDEEYINAWECLEHSSSYE